MCLSYIILKNCALLFKSFKTQEAVKTGQPRQIRLTIVEASSTQIFLTTPRFPDVGKWNILLCRNEIHFTLERISRMWAQGHPKQHGNYQIMSLALPKHTFLIHFDLKKKRPLKYALDEIMPGPFVLFWSSYSSGLDILGNLGIVCRYWVVWNRWSNFQ